MYLPLRSYSLIQDYSTRHDFDVIETMNDKWYVYEVNGLHNCGFTVCGLLVQLTQVLKNQELKIKLQFVMELSSTTKECLRKIENQTSTRIDRHYDSNGNVICLEIEGEISPCTNALSQILSGVLHLQSSPLKPSGYCIPENWFNVSKCGARVAHSNLIPFKVPLDKRYSIVEDEKRWLPLDFIEEQNKRGYNVRLVIDLTSSDHYYDKEEFVSRGIHHIKLKIQGNGAPLKKEAVLEFLEIVRRFNTIPENANAHIGVHCTHGLNRTGFMIVAYLFGELGMLLPKAIHEFAKARPPGIIRHSYHDELFRYHNLPLTNEYPHLPDWAQKKYSNLFSQSNK